MKFGTKFMNPYGSRLYFEKYLSPNFKPKKKTFDWTSRGGCGTSALAIITNLTQPYIDSHLSHNEDCWTDERIVEFLRQRGYDVEEVTLTKIGAKASSGSYVITHDHVVLIGQEIFITKTDQEGTWSVVHNGKRWHNCHVEKFNPLELVNNPIDTCYVISHKSWK